MKNTKKALILAACAVLLICTTVFSTLAYLQASSDTKKNTFTIGKVEIELDETEGEEDENDENNRLFKMTPGSEIDKDPTVTVLADSEDCYVFVKIEKGGNVDNYITYEISDSWELIDADEGIYAYKEIVEASDSDTVLDSILDGDKVTVKDTVEEIAEGDVPTLTFTAYAIQSDNMDDAEDAWSKFVG